MSSSRSVLAVTRWLIVAAIVIESLVIVGFVLGHYGLGWNLPDPGAWRWEGDAVMSAQGVLGEPPVVDIDLAWEDTSEGTVDASTGMPPVSLTGPFTARVSIWSPSTMERVLYVMARIAVPVLAIGVLWLLHRLVSSVRSGTPFTAENARRIFWLASIIGLGGTLAGAYPQWVDAWLISNSAAAPAFSSQVSFSFVPLLIGLVLAVLAVAWTRGVTLEAETEGLV